MKTIIIAVLACGLMAQAQTSTTSTTTTSQTSGDSTAKIKDLQKKDEQMKDTDQDITNAKLRASMGSKSRWSVRSSVIYNGGTVQRAFHEQRPNITAGNANDATSDLSADLAVKYRTTDNTSLNFGTGLTVKTPFHKTTDHVINSNGERSSSVSNPYLEYNIAGKTGAIQNFLSGTYVHITKDFLKNTVGMDRYFDLSHQGIVEVGNLSLGLASTVVKYDYNNNQDTYAFRGEASDRSDVEACFSPFAEYAVNDKYSLRTVSNWFCFTQNRNENSLNQDTPQQSVGLGISVTRDIYLYPNVQFIPQDIRADRTNVALSANINIF